MTRARELARLANENVFTAEDYNSPVQVGINSTDPTSTLDVRGELKVGTAIQAGTAGVVTATEFSGSIGTFSGAGSFGGNLDVTGNVTIGGTLTYEDVTNIDVIGIVTAQNGVNISGGQLLVGSGVTIGNAGVATFSGTSDIHLRDNVKLNVGDGSDHALYHDGTQTSFEGTVPLYIKGSNVIIYKGGTTDKMLQCTGDGASSLWYSASKKIETTNDGTVTTGIATATGLDIADKITHTGDANTAIRFPSADTISLETAGSERARVTSDGEFLVGTTTDNGFKFKVSDGGASEFAFAPNDSGVNSLVNYDRVGSAYTNFKIAALEQEFWVGTSPSEKFKITSGGLVQIDTPGVTAGNGASAKLQVDSSSQYDGLLLGNSATYGTISRGANNGALVYTSNAYPANLGGGEKITHEWWSGNAGGGGPDQLMVLSASGRLGIGITNPSANLHLGAQNDSTPKLYVRNHTAAGAFNGNYGSEFRHAFGSINHCMLIHAEEAADARRVLDISDSNGIFATFTHGKVGINTTTPDGKLEINASGSTNMLMFSNSGTNFAKLGYNAASGIAVLDVRSEGHMRFLTGGNNERLRISNDAGVELTGHSECNFNALGNSSGTVTIDFTTANYISCTLTGTTTFANPTTESVGQSGSIIITQDGTGSRTASWGSQFKWVGGTAPTLTTTAAAVDRIDYLVVAADTIHCVASLDVK